IVRLGRELDRLEWSKLEAKRLGFAVACLGLDDDLFDKWLVLEVAWIFARVAHGSIHFLMFFEIVEISAELLRCSQNHFAAGARPSIGATPCSFLAATTFIVIGENRQALDAGKNGEGFNVVGRARRPHRLQQCAAMHNPGRGIERGLYTFGKAKPLRHL